MNALLIYWSKSGNTEKVAQVIREGLEETGTPVICQRIDDIQVIDFYEYDLVCIGFPAYQWHPPEPVDTFLKKKFGEYRQQGRIKLGAPQVPGKHALVFCTYSGPHTGINEALPAGKYVGQFFEHLGFTLWDEWYILGEFHGSAENSTKGRMGDIRGRPNAGDLQKLKQDTVRLIHRIQAQK